MGGGWRGVPTSFPALCCYREVDGVGYLPFFPLSPGGTDTADDDAARQKDQSYTARDHRNQVAAPEGRP